MTLTALVSLIALTVVRRDTWSIHPSGHRIFRSQDNAKVFGCAVWPMSFSWLLALRCRLNSASDPKRRAQECYCLDSPSCSTFDIVLTQNSD
ncbi:hypothetical protein BJV74DRAFT_854428 [Russula compacta]|nr:hypothetical protein BJV74DRAFT_854428 [Russula compacta]